MVDGAITILTKWLDELLGSTVKDFKGKTSTHDRVYCMCIVCVFAFLHARGSETCGQLFRGSTVYAPPLWTWTQTLFVTRMQ